jgi:hypothetical protein
VNEDSFLPTAFSSSSSDWNTPLEILDLVVRVFGEIDLDPCSDAAGNVPAKQRYMKGDNGLTRLWFGRVYMNPPYGREIDAWVRKFVDSFREETMTEGIALVPARVDTQWFRRFGQAPVCFVTGRLKFSGCNNSAPFPSAVFYLGGSSSRFADVFSGIGRVFVPFAPSRVGGVGPLWNRRPE